MPLRRCLNARTKIKSSLVESYARGLLLFLPKLGSLGQFSVARVFRFCRVPGTWTSPGYVDCVERPPEIYLTRRERPPSSSVRESMLDGLWRDMALDVAVVIFRAIDESVRPGYVGRSRASDVHVERCDMSRVNLTAAWLRIWMVALVSLPICVG